MLQYLEKLMFYCYYYKELCILSLLASYYYDFADSGYPSWTASDTLFWGREYVFFSYRNVNNFCFALTLKQNICPLKRKKRITWKTKQPSTYFWHVLLPAKKRQLLSMWQDPRPHVQGRSQRHRTSKGVSAASSERKQQRPEERSPWAIHWITPPVLKYVPVRGSRFSLWMWGFTRNTTLQPIWLWF